MKERAYRRGLVFSLVAALATLAFGATGARVVLPTVGTIDAASGSFSILRDGQALKDADIGTEVLDEDLVVTGADGRVSIALAKTTGMSGSIKVSPSTRFYLRTDSLGGEPKNEAELIAGQLALKVKKLGGTPAFNVSAETAVAAVRGTEFTVTASEAGDLLVACSDGEVAVSDEAGQDSVVPGRALEKAAGSRLSRLAVKVEDLQSFQADWSRKRSGEFRQHAGKNARLIIQRYLALAERLASVHRELGADGILRAWAEEKRDESPPAKPKELAAEILAVGPKLVEAGRIISAMERMTARVEALKEALGPGDPALREALRPGFTVGDFFARFDAETLRNQERTTWVRHAARLLKLKQLERREAAGG